MLRQIPNIKFDDHDLGNLEVFPSLDPQLYLKQVVDGGVLKVDPMVWVMGLAGVVILKLLCLPHFGRYNITNLIIRQLLALVHDGCLWLQGCIPIDSALIHRITGLPMHGPNL